MAIDLILHGIDAKNAEEAREILTKVRECLVTREWAGNYTIKLTDDVSGKREKD